jgi:hypothetical protein
LELALCDEGEESVPELACVLEVDVVCELGVVDVASCATANGANAAESTNTKKRLIFFMGKLSSSIKSVGQLPTYPDARGPELVGRFAVCTLRFVVTQGIKTRYILIQHSCRAKIIRFRTSMGHFIEKFIVLG